MMKKFYCLFTAMLMALSLNTISYGASDSSLDSFIHALTAAEENHISKIDCSDYNLTDNMISYAAAYVEINNPYLYGVSEFECVYGSGGKIKTVILTYDYTAQEYSSQKAEIDAAIEKIAATAEGMTNPEKVQAVYNYLAENYTYDTTLSTKEYNVYTLFAEGRGMCKTFSLAFKLIMDELDIPCKVETNVTSYNQNFNSPSNHVWNEVYANEGWNQIDLTQKHRNSF